MGGQSIPTFDYGLAPYVSKTFIGYVDRYIDIMSTDSTCDCAENELLRNALKERLTDYWKERNGRMLDKIGLSYVKSEIEGRFPYIDSEHCIDKCFKYTENETYQGMEALIHNLNTMNSRAGAQVPFSSINYGTDTSVEGRMITKNVLLAHEAGLGSGETPIFPIHIFKCKQGINMNDGEPNYDLFKLACRVSAKRLFPNFENIDAPFNLQYYKEGKPETEIATMGCRTRVIGNVYDTEREIVTGRGNLSFTTINLPRLAILSSGNLDEFYERLDSMMSLVKEQLLDRFEIQCNKTIKNYPFLMAQGVWIDSEKLNMDDDLRSVLSHGSLSIGFIGLAEALKSLTGNHHGENEESQKLGLEIISRMRSYVDRMADKYKLNFSLLATPAEGLSGRFLRIDRERFGVIEGVTDRDYYTNSFHVPVYHQISVVNKIDIEAPYHALTNAGHISYVELDGDPSRNLASFEKIVKYMCSKGIGYGSINHPVDRDPICGYTGIIYDTCPYCGRKDGEPLTPEKYREIISKNKIPKLDSFMNAED